MEALGLTACQYNFMHKYLDDPSYTKPLPDGKSSSEPLALLNKMADDSRLKGLFKSPSLENLSQLFEKHEDLILEYWNAWDISPSASANSSPIEQFRLSQEAAVNLLVATIAPGTHGYNFFTVHLLTTSHAVRVLLPLIPRQFHIALVRQWWLLVIAVYASLLCPKIDPDYVRPEDWIKQRSWKYVVDKALNGPYAADAHFVKGKSMRLDVNGSATDYVAVVLDHSGHYIMLKKKPVCHMLIRFRQCSCSRNEGGRPDLG